MIERENYSKIRKGRKTERQNERKYCKKNEKIQFPRSRCNVHTQRCSRTGPNPVKPVLDYDVLIITQALILVP